MHLLSPELIQSHKNTAPGTTHSGAPHHQALPHRHGYKQSQWHSTNVHNVVSKGEAHATTHKTFHSNKHAVKKPGRNGHLHGNRVYRPTNSSETIVTSEAKSLHRNRIYNPNQTVQDSEPTTVVSGIPETVKTISAPRNQTTSSSASDVTATKTHVARDPPHIIPALSAIDVCAATTTEKIRRYVYINFGPPSTPTHTTTHTQTHTHTHTHTHTLHKFVDTL